MSRYDGSDEPLTRWEALAEVAKRVQWGHQDEQDEIVTAILGDQTPEPSPREGNIGAPSAPLTTPAEPDRDLVAAIHAGSLVVVPAPEYAELMDELLRLRELLPEPVRELVPDARESSPKD